MPILAGIYGRQAQADGEEEESEHDKKKQRAEEGNDVILYR